MSAEIIPQHLRSYGMGIAFACQGISSLWLGQVTPIAFAAIQWRYYSVFITAMVISAGIIAWGMPETVGLSLEEVAGCFGEVVVEGKMVETEDKEKQEHVEHA